MRPSTFVVIPAYNEQATIADVIRKARKFCEKVVVVDDGSTDETAMEAERAGAILLKHLVNIGKGAALKTGCDYAIRKEAEQVIVMDGDGQHNPGQIPNFVKALQGCDVVLGYRSLDNNMPTVLRLGNKLIEACTRILYSIRINDTQSGFRAFTRKAYRKLRWEAQDYSIESEMISLIAKHKLCFRQIPIETIYNDRYKGTTVFDGVRIVINMFWWRLTR